MKKNPTDTEAIIAKRLRGWGFRCIEQFIIEPYIADLYLPFYKTIIELDGSVHNYPSRIKRDKSRDDFLRAKDFKVARIENEVAIKMNKQDFIDLLNGQNRQIVDRRFYANYLANL